MIVLTLCVRLEHLVVDVHAAAGSVAKHVDCDDTELIDQLLVDGVLEQGIGTETMEHQKCRLAVLLTFIVMELENLLVTHYEGPHLDYLAAAEAELYVLADHVLIGHLT